MGILSGHKKEKDKAEEFYKSIGQINCPYFHNPVIFNSDGFHHLQFSDGSEREKPAQLLKFDLLHLVPEILKKAGTIQEYRKQWGKVGRKKANGSQEMKEIEYWGFIAIVFHRDRNIKIKIVCRRVGDGNVTFWSIMPEGHIRNKDTFHLATGDLSED